LPGPPDEARPHPATAEERTSGDADGADDATLGAGELSTAARDRLAAMTPERLDPPAPEDLAAVAVWRAAVHRAWLEGDPPPAEAGHVEAVVGGVRCLVAGDLPGGGAVGAPGRPTLVHLHGGGYALGSPEVAVPITSRLAAGGLAVVSVDYRLAPEHPHPAAVEDALAVYGAVDRVAAGRPVALAGDSAGGNLVVSVAMAAAAAGLRPPAALVLMSPHLDLASAPDGDGRWLADAYRGTRDAADPAVSPLRAGNADLARLPPTLVQTGTADALLGHAVRFARRARAVGVDVTLDVWDGLWHTWQYHRELPEAHQALAEAARFVLAHTTVAPPPASPPGSGPSNGGTPGARDG
jgi:acetyl esterase/lipase